MSELEQSARVRCQAGQGPHGSPLILVALCAGLCALSATRLAAAQLVDPLPEGKVPVSSKRLRPSAPTSDPDPNLVLEVIVQGQSQADKSRESSEAVKVVEMTRVKRQSADLGEVLAHTAGVAVRRSGGLGSGTRFSLNGLTDDQIRFFLDEVPLAYAGYRFGIANVPTHAIDRVEIYSGVVPVRFGADALGGAVNLVSTPKRAGSHGATSYQAGELGTHRATHRATYLSESSGFFLGVDGFFDSARNDYLVDVEVPNAVGRPEPASVHRFHDQYLAAGASLQAGWLNRPWADQLLFKGFASHYDKDIQHNAVMTVPYGGATFAETAVGGNARFAHAVSDVLQLNATAGYVFDRSRFRDLDSCAYNWFGRCVAERPRGGEIDGSPHDQLTWQHSTFARLRAELMLSPQHTLLLATSPSFATRTGDERVQSVLDTRDPLTAQRDLLSWVSGLEHIATLFGDHLEARVFLKHYLQAARSEEEVATDVFVDRDRTTQRLGLGSALRWRLTEKFSLKGSYEWATRLPRPDEVFGDNSLLLPNLQLEPEVSHNANIGVALHAQGSHSGSWRAEVTGFVRDADNLIVRLSDDTFQFYRNVYSARSTGVEATAAWTAPGQWLALDLNTTYQSFRNTSDDGLFTLQKGDRIPNRPYFFGNASLRLQHHNAVLPRDEISLTTTLRYVHPFFRGWESLGLRQYKQVVPGYLLSSLGLTYLTRGPQRTLSATLEIFNLTDTQVQDYFGVQRPGRNVQAKLAWQY